ncbi:hypothetical protein [Ramlibacter sp. AN1133]
MRLQALRTTDNLWAARLPLSFAVPGGFSFELAAPNAKLLSGLEK